MNNEEEHIKHITAQQIENYVAARMTDEEMNRVERHLLDCEFCSAAVKGIDSSKTVYGFHDDVDILQTRIDNKVAGQKTKPAYLKILGIAATVLILIGVGFMVFLFTDVSSNKPLLSERKSKQKEEVKSSIADLVLSKSNLDTLNKNTEYFDSIIIKPVIVPVANFNVAEVQSNYSTPTSSVSAFSNSEQSFKILEVELASSDEEVEETLVMLDEEVADETPIETDQLKTLEEDSIVIKDFTETNSGSDELAVVEISKPEMKLAPALIQQSVKSSTLFNSDSLADKIKSATPVRGFKSYGKYISRKLKMPKKASNNNITGIVKLSFEVDENGKPKNVTVIKGLGFGCNEEAIRLIQKGPVWEVGFSNKIKYQIEF